MPVTKYGFEPDFQEVMEEPIIQLVMQRDGVSNSYLFNLLEENNYSPQASGYAADVPADEPEVEPAY